MQPTLARAGLIVELAFIRLPNRMKASHKFWENILNSFRKLVVDNGKFTTIPNWYWDKLINRTPPAFSIFLGYLLRRTIGWDSNTFFVRNLTELAAATNVDRENISAYAKVLDAVDWIKYQPAVHAREKTTFTIGPKFPFDSDSEVEAFLIGFNSALEQIREFSRENARLRRSQTNAYSEYQERPRPLAWQIAELTKRKVNEQRAQFNQ